MASLNDGDARCLDDTVFRTRHGCSDRGVSRRRDRAYAEAKVASAQRQQPQLRRFEVSLITSKRPVPMVQTNNPLVLVGESNIFTYDDYLRLKEPSIGIFFVGKSLIYIMLTLWQQPAPCPKAHRRLLEPDMTTILNPYRCCRRSQHVDVSDKAETMHAIVTKSTPPTFKQETPTLILSDHAKKGDVLSTARIADIMVGCTHTHELKSRSSTRSCSPRSPSRSNTTRFCQACG